MRHGLTPFLAFIIIGAILVILFVPAPSIIKEEISCKIGAKCPKKGDLIFEQSLAQKIFAIITNQQQSQTIELNTNRSPDTDQLATLSAYPIKPINPEDVQDWKIHTNGQFGFSFKYPSRLSICNKCQISGPASSSANNLVVIVDVPTLRRGTDAPFDGLAVYIDPNPNNLSLVNYIEAEKRELLQKFRAFTQQAPPQQGVEQTFKLKKQPGIILKNYSWDNITRFYVLLPERQILILTKTAASNQSQFNIEFDQILSTFKFLE